MRSRRDPNCPMLSWCEVAGAGAAFSQAGSSTQSPSPRQMSCGERHSHVSTPGLSAFTRFTQTQGSAKQAGSSTHCPSSKQSSSAGRHSHVSSPGLSCTWFTQTQESSSFIAEGVVVVSSRVHASPEKPGSHSEHFESSGPVHVTSPTQFSIAEQLFSTILHSSTW